MLAGVISSQNRSVRMTFFFLWMGALYLFVAFRYEVGCDWFGYKQNFDLADNLQTTDLVSMSEPAYWFLITTVHEWQLDYPYINVLMAIPFFLGLSHLARRQPDPLAFLILSFPVLIINMPMSAIRQSAAIGLICFALVAFQNKHFIKYILYVIAATAFHTSAMIFLAIAPFVKYRLSRWTLTLSLVSVLPGAYFMLTDSLSIYSDRYVGTAIEAEGGIFRSSMLVVTALLFFLMLRKPFKVRCPTDYQMVLIGSWIMLATLPLVFISSVISDRFGYYVTPIQLIVLSRIPYLLDGQRKTVLSASPYIALGIVLVVWTSLSFHFQLCYIPYQNWLFM